MTRSSLSNYNQKQSNKDHFKQMTGGQALIDSIYKEGIRVVFGLPGVQTYHAVIPILDYPDMQFITTRHEQATTYMADGYARASGKIGVSLVVPGPGLQNASAGITNAYSASSPILVISGQINKDKIGKDIGILHEINDQLDIVRPITKWQSRVLEAKNVPSAVQQSFSHLKSGRARPVLIEIPPETLGEEASFPAYEKSRPYTSSIDYRAIEEAAELLVQSANNVIWAGGGIHGSNASPELLDLAEYLQIPIITTPEGKGAISDRHYLSLGVTRGRSTGEFRDPLRDFFYNCDVVLAIGTRFATAKPNPSQKVIQIDVDSDEIGRNHNNTLGIVGDLKNVLPVLLEAIKSHSKPKTSRKSEFEIMRTERYENPDNQIEPLDSYVRALRKSIPDDGILVPDMTQIGYYSRTNFKVYNPRTYFTSSYTGNLGSAFPTALGAKVAMPDTPVVCVAGDGGFLFNSQELATARQFNINVVTVVFNDNAYGNVFRDMKELFNGRSLGAELKNPNFLKLAEAYNITGMQAKSPEELTEVIDKSLEMNEPVLIEVPFGPMPSPFFD